MFRPEESISLHSVDYRIVTTALRRSHSRGIQRIQLMVELEHLVRPFLLVGDTVHLAGVAVPYGLWDSQVFNGGDL